MASDDQSNSVALINSVEKAELMSAIGREIERIDRLSASNGYTSWALWAAIGVLGWKAIEILRSVDVTEELGRAYVLFFLIFVLFYGLSASIGKEKSKRGGHAYFRSPGFGKADHLRMAMVLAVSAICILTLVHRSSDGALFWFPISFYVLPALTPLVVLGPKIPVADASPKKGPARFGLWLLVGWMALGGVSLAILCWEFDWTKVIRPSSEAQLALLFVVMTILFFSLTRNVQVEERRASFQRLETELTLSKIDVHEARERYENLMLGMNMSVAVRPWVDAVMIPLDEANAGLYEVKQLLDRAREIGPGGDKDSDALSTAILQRASTLLDNVEGAVSTSGKAYKKLTSVCYALFGEREIGASPIAPEAERIAEAQRKVKGTLVDVKGLLKEYRVGDDGSK